MRLDRIKLSGFKSFVDPTIVALPGNLLGVVGPNGCGKSNIIDAIRWVMGESSAKQLRGDSITDVIFNGSVNRKPIGQAAIELIFDNSDGKLGGQYAAYAQIAIKREVNRDGLSNYYLNGARCRRRDITDVFLGTGLGPRSYSIIEQGMISQVVEAKPEELRSYLEEVAGISKYKERRRETENRIKHTKENLERVDDLRQELTKQLERLKRQAAAAQRYKVLKQEERLLKAQLLALRTKDLAGKISQYSGEFSKLVTALEAHNAAAQNFTTQLDKANVSKNEQQEAYNKLQEKFYSLSSEIAQTEQEIAHKKQNAQKFTTDLEQLTITIDTAKNNLFTDQTALSKIENEIIKIDPLFLVYENDFAKIKTELKAAEENMHAWQIKWDQFHHENALIAQKAELSKAELAHEEQKLLQIQNRIGNINKQLENLQSTDVIEKELESLKNKLTETKSFSDSFANNLNLINSNISIKRNEIIDSNKKAQNSKQLLQNLRSKKVSLETLQHAALGKTDVNISKWLRHHNLHESPRLAQHLKVAKGWEKSVETVLGDYLQAVCTDNIDIAAAGLDLFDKGTLTLFDFNNLRCNSKSDNYSEQLLVSKVATNLPVEHFLSGVYVADDLMQAFLMRNQLQAHESVITKDGIWLGYNWLRVARDHDHKHGVIAREEELNKITQEILQQEKIVLSDENLLKETGDALFALEKQKDILVNDINKQKELFANVNANVRVKESEFLYAKNQFEKLQQELQEQQNTINFAKEKISLCKKAWSEALAILERDAQKREELLKERLTCNQILFDVRKAESGLREKMHSVSMQKQTMQAQLNSLLQAIDRGEKHVAILHKQICDIQDRLQQDKIPLTQIEIKLTELLQQHTTIDKDVLACKQKLNAIDYDITRLNVGRSEVVTQIENARNILAEKKLQEQEIKVRMQTLNEQIVESGFVEQTLLEQMPPEATENSWQENIEKTVQRISRLGAINLAAIDECKEISERKDYIDRQYADLTESLETLLNAIRKIDKETRTKFKETFDYVNDTFRNLFPKLFGGGSGYLELTGDDLLDTGVTVMAKPPGKHISTINLLSGGEKAMTAIALVFSLFQLNPAPFCMLDEVDAPLDDNNVGRFCNLVKEMSQKVQFIFISHNKMAIEMADHLIGVTMNEPGVSRIVTVDVNAAVAMLD